MQRTELAKDRKFAVATLDRKSRKEKRRFKQLQLLTINLKTITKVLI